jgi:uncharacterized protein (TIGR02001 family)
MPIAARCALAAALCLAAAGAADAADAQTVGPASFTFGVGAATDYELRGVSQTRRHGQVFGSVDATFGSVGYAGGWASNVDFGDGTDAEYDLYAGVKPKLGPVTVDVGVIRYGFSGQRSGGSRDYTELKLAPSMALGPATFGAAWYHSEDYFSRLGPSNYVEANATLPIGGSPFSVSGAVGHQQVKGPDDYTTWNLGVGYAVGNHLGFDLRYWDTDAHGLSPLYRARLVLSMKATFP